MNDTVLDDEYEIVEGQSLGGGLETLEEAAIPPEWIRNLRVVPELYRHATLSKENEELFHPDMLDTCRRFVRSWFKRKPLEEGRSLALIGSTGAGKTWAAAATVNDLHKWCGRMSTLRTAWLSVPVDIPDLFQTEKFHKQPEYYQLFNRYREADLLVIDDVLHMAAHDFDKTRAFIYGLLEYRYLRKRPVIVTANANVQADDWSEIEEAMDVAFVRRLREMAKGYTVVSYSS